MKKIKYICKNCGWETAIWEEWQDLKPQRCMNRKCNTSFRLNPDSLEIIKPLEQLKQETKEEKKNGQTKNNKRKELSDA